MTPSTVILAQELIDAIIDNIGSTCTNDYLARETLRSCSLVNKHFLPRCRMHLFKEVKLSNQYMAFTTNSNRVSTLLELLEHPLSRIVPYVQVLHLRDAFWEPDLPKILPFLQHIRILYLRMRPGTTSWWAFSPTFQGALSQTMLLQSLEEVNVRGFTDLPASLFKSPSLRKLSIRDSTLDNDPMAIQLQQYLPPQPTELVIRGSFPLISSLFNDSSTLSASKLSHVHFTVNSSEEVAIAETIIRSSSITIERLSFINVFGETEARPLLVAHQLPPSIDESLPHLPLPDYPTLHDVHLELQTSFQSTETGLPSSLHEFLMGISPNSSMRSLHIRIRWDSVNPDIPWNTQALVESWAEIDGVLSHIGALKTVTVAFMVNYNNGKDVWTHEDVMALENASNRLDEYLGRLLPKTSQNGVRTRVFREPSW